MKSWAVLCLITGFLTGASASEPYPVKPLRLLVPFASGSGVDALALVLSKKLSEKLGQPVLVENRPGAGGVIAATQVAKAAPDGYTLLLATSATHSLGPATNPKLPFKVAADFTPVIELATAPHMFLVPQVSPAKSIRELVDLARQKPGKLNYASSGQGSISHLTVEYFLATTGTEMHHIPYRSSENAAGDVISGQLDLMVDSLVTGLPQVKAGRLRALGLTSLTPSALAPGVPVLSNDLPGFESSTWYGLYGPKGLPEAITQKLNQAVNAVLLEKDIKNSLTQLGAEATGGTPQALAQRVKNDTDKWSKVVRDRRIVID